MEAVVLADKTALLSSIGDFLAELPADTKSVQCVLYAYTDDYDNYGDKTKCVAEADAWFNLSDEEQLDLLGGAVTTCLKRVSGYIAAASETEEDLLAKEELLTELKKTFKNLSRSFVIYMDNLDTASLANEQLERLFDGILAQSNRAIFSAAFDIFKKREALSTPMEELQWKLLSAKTKPKAAAVKPPIGKPAVPAPEPEVKATAKSA